ncbi:MAG: PP0621 family protein [Ramlibacter sp.]|uniref:PP0621 family protein n=1 Tax=Ramlibacter sp. TaxID=1917967 RepID=UPI00262D4CBD|nr:PP0621 family protein [Ramlibacter sp.]MDH4375922.1 PP0621 family protein [Ramlibacter sp.]
MKYLIVLALLAYLYFAWRKQRGNRPGNSARSPGPERRSETGAAPQEMVCCDRCGLHLPRNESLTDGRGGTFCCAQHREPGSA